MAYNRVIMGLSGGHIILANSRVPKGRVQGEGLGDVHDAEYLIPGDSCCYSILKLDRISTINRWILKKSCMTPSTLYLVEIVVLRYTAIMQDVYYQQ